MQTASYAKQAQDEELKNMARRIRGRAERRIGELLKQIKPGHGLRPEKDQDGSGPIFETRKGAAEAAGLSERQTKTAIRVANVPQERFDEMIEGDEPATITAIAKEGTQHRAESENIVDLKWRDSTEYKLAHRLVGSFEDAASHIERIPFDAHKHFLNHEERQQLRGHLARIDAVAKRVSTKLKAADQGAA